MCMCKLLMPRTSATASAFAFALAEPTRHFLNNRVDWPAQHQRNLLLALIKCYVEQTAEKLLWSKEDQETRPTTRVVASTTIA